jgi:D-glycero-D-manno-heptose 1,7-bisphosphate phosphatase
MIQTAFVDRDGTINRKPAEGDYIKTPAELELVAGAAAAIKRLNDEGVRVIVVTNQRGIALGRMSERDLANVHDRLRTDLAREGAQLDGMYYCPHDLHECECRKPRLGLFRRALDDHSDIDFARSAVIGDSITDMEPGTVLGMTTVLLGSEAGGVVHGWIHRRARVDRVARSLGDAVQWLIGPAAPGPGSAERASTARSGVR